MAEQDRQMRVWKAVSIFAVIVAALVIVAGCKKKSPEQSGTKPEQHKHSSSLNNVIRSARSWRPAYTPWYGKTAPDFTLTDLAGKEHKLSDYRGKDVMLVFWATWCKYCIPEIPHLIELRNTVSEDKLAILAISYITIWPPNTTEIVKNFVERNKKINYTVFSADVSDMPAPYNQVTGIPCSFFINAEGKIKLATVGPLSFDSMKAILQAE